jgi:hypothetical protein
MNSQLIPEFSFDAVDPKEAATPVARAPVEPSGGTTVTVSRRKYVC